MSATLSELRNTPVKFRDHTDIMAQVLHAASGGSTATKIMYKAFLSFNQLKECSTLLSTSELLTFDQKIKIFRTTPKGLEFVDMYDKLNELLGLAATDNPKKGYSIKKKK